MKKYLLIALLLHSAQSFSQSFTQTGLVYWLKSDQGVDTTANGLVSAWANSAAGTNTARQSNTANQPRFIRNGLNSRPVIQFNGSQWLETDNNLSLDQFTIVAVFNSLENSQQVVYELGENTNASDGAYLSTSLNSTILVNKNGIVIGKNHQPFWGAEGGSFKVVTFANSNDANSLLFQVNGSKPNLSNPLGVDNLDPISGTIQKKLLIGSRKSTSIGLKGNIAEILVYNRRLSTTEVASVENYLASRYNLTIQRFQIPTHNLQLWLRADSGVDTTVDGRVTSWRSSFGTNALIQPVNSRRPVRVFNGPQGRPTISFNGTNVLYSQNRVPLMGVPESIIQLRGFTVFAAFRSTTNGLGMIYEHSSNSNSGGSYLSTSNNSSIFVRNGASLFRDYAPNWGNTGNMIVVANHHSQNIQDFHLRVNGSQQISQGVSQSQNTETSERLDTLFLGARGVAPTFGLVGQISEFLIYRCRLSTGEIQQIENYLMDKYLTGNYFEVLSAERQTASSKVGFELEQNYPNPFNPSTTIRFQLPESGLTQVKVYDALGREVATLLNERLSKGAHSISFNASGLSSGMYFYRLISNNRAITKKMILVK